MIKKGGTMLLKVVAGLTTVVLLFISCLIGTILIMGPSIPLLILRPDLYRKFNDTVIQLWLILPGAIFEVIAWTKLKVYGKKPPPEEPCLIIMNHRCRLDWMFYWMVMLRYGSLKSEKILMRNDLKWMPGAGWAMQSVLYFFLRRRWEQDEAYMSSLLDYYIDIDYPLQLLLFPEGTNYCPEGCAKSDSFAKKNGLPLYKYCLHPRVRGFNFIVQKLRTGIIKSILDVTIAYPKGLCYGEIDLIKSNFPEEVLVHIDRYDINDIPVESEELDKWCNDRWKDKEEFLRKIYTEGYVPDVGSDISDSDRQQADAKARSIYILILLFWVIFMTLSTSLLYCYYWLRVYFVAMGIFYVLQQIIFGGMDNIQLSFHSYRKKKDSGKLS